MENKDWLGFESFETEETETKKKALQCKTLNEIMALYSNDRSMVNISKPLTLSSMIGVDNAVISEVKPVCAIFDMMRENSADGHKQNTDHQNVTKRRVGRNRRTNSMTINTAIDHREVGDEIKQVKGLSVLPTKLVENNDDTDYSNKFDMDDERQNGSQKALRSPGKLEKEALPVINIERFAVSKLKAGFKTIKSHYKLENE